MKTIVKKVETPILKDIKYDLIVVGGGASGMMAAGVAAQAGARVLLLEKNKELGKKLKISGGGRCNITHAEYDQRKLLKYYGSAEQFLYSTFAQFGVQDTFDYFTSRGLPLVVQEKKRAFPHTEKASDVFELLYNILKKYNVVVKSDTPVTKILTEVENTNKKIIGVATKGAVYTAKNYIIATGGKSHPETGSTGDGFKWLADIGHTIVEPTPSIVPLAVQEQWVKSLSGVSLSFMRITFYINGKSAFKKLGKILFTHFGISGPLILNSAKKVADLLQEGKVTATIDVYPDTNHGALEERILKIFDSNKNKMLKNIFKEIVPEGTNDAIFSLLQNIDGDKKVHSITKEERKQIVSLLKALPLTIYGLMGFDRAVVADGGVPLNEINTKTMQSKLYDNLFITGDLLHINRPTGGQSLQLCWTTGYVAGTHCAK